ncbi:MAG: hypothetical protein HYX53_05510 [Chloroflexi bacterium]|nr:hypothetical protein [Chloroflexota bacterium]
MAEFRVAPPRVFREATGAARPPATAAGSADAHRQASFVLGGDVDLVLRGLELEGAVAEASSAAKYRTHVLAACMGAWSRSWLARQQALHAVQWGNYASAFPLVRASADYQAAFVALLQTGAAEWIEWLDGGGVALAPADHALQYRLHPFRSGEVLAAHTDLGAVYRAATDFALPHFGATLLVAGSDSDATRVAMTFGDRDFHLGLAELALGWLELLGAVQVEELLGAAGRFAVADEGGLRAFAGDGRAALARDGRCHLEVVERAGESRYLVHNWRRTPGAAQKRVLL